MCLVPRTLHNKMSNAPHVRFIAGTFGAYISSCRLGSGQRKFADQKPRHGGIQMSAIDNSIQEGPEQAYHVCPHCRTKVPSGATVCTGCQAEVSYGVPGGAILAVLIISAWIALAFCGWTSLGLVVFFVLVFLGGFLCFRVFKNRVSLKRIYRTK